MLKILCKLGFHKWDTLRYIQVKRQRGKHRWHRNYMVCTRCGKRMAFSIRKLEELKKDEFNCDWCQPRCEVCGTCLDFFLTGKEDCKTQANEDRCEFWRPMYNCPKCGRSLEGRI